ncbi:MAG: GGDEF domain-containing protein [Bacilli bacterium]|jgi:diguanylate cyclase (GGDEF)-like protein
MDPITSVLTNAFLLIVLISAYWYIRRQLTRGDFGHRTLRYIFIITTVLLAADAVMRINHSYAIYNDAICTTCILIGCIMLPLLALLWFIYTCRATNLTIKLWIVYIIAAVIFAANTVLVVLSVIPGADIYFIIQNHVMHLGRFYFIYAAILLIPFVASLVVVFMQWKIMNRKRNPLTFFNFSMIPIVAIIGQYFFVNYSLSLMGIVVSFIIIILDIQHQYAVTDFLTGLCNRRNITKFLAAKIKELRNGDKFAGFMLDINNFKSINDKYGHNFGDRVLIDVSNVLIGVTEKRDYIGRFGGDEFVIIADVKNEEEIVRFTAKIRQACDKYNSNENKTHTIEFSIGSALYEKAEALTPTRFLEIIDDRMYIDKQSTKSI